MTGVPSADVSLLATFEQLDVPTKNILAHIRNDLRLGLAALMLAEDKAGHSPMSAEQIAACLEAAGVAVKRAQIVKAFSRTNDKISRKTIDDEIHYKLMTLGRKEVEPYFRAGTIGVFFIEAGQPRTARKTLRELFSELKGDIRLCDPYFGVRSLEVLEMLPATSSVHFLTVHITDSDAVLAGPLGDFKTDRPKTELRIFPPPGNIHDRYLFTDDVLFLLGHGIKDVGKKDSFVVCITKEYAADVLQELRTSFDDKWSRSTVR